MYVYCHGLVVYRRLPTAQIGRPAVLAQLVRALDYRCTLQIGGSGKQPAISINRFDWAVVRLIRIESITSNHNGLVQTGLCQTVGAI